MSNFACCEPAEFSAKHVSPLLILHVHLCIICINQSHTWLLRGSTYIRADWAQQLFVLTEVLNLLTKMCPIKWGRGSARIHL